MTIWLVNLQSQSISLLYEGWLRKTPQPKTPQLNLDFQFDKVSNISQGTFSLLHKPKSVIPILASSHKTNILQILYVRLSWHTPNRVEARGYHDIYAMREGVFYTNKNYNDVMCQIFSEVNIKPTVLKMFTRESNTFCSYWVALKVTPHIPHIPQWGITPYTPWPI